MYCRFFTKYGMPGVIGVVDGTHIYIKKPENDVEFVYYSVRKAAHTKNVQIVSKNENIGTILFTIIYTFQICDFNLKIIGLNARYGGSSHDSFVWNNSFMRRVLEEEYSHGIRNSFLLGM